MKVKAKGKRLRHPPLLQLRRGNESGGGVLGVLQLALPPVVVVLGDDLDDVAHAEAHPRLLAGDELVPGGVVLELSPDVDLHRNRGRVEGRGRGGVEEEE